MLTSREICSFGLVWSCSTLLATNVHLCYESEEPFYLIIAECFGNLDSGGAYQLQLDLPHACTPLTLSK